MVTVWWFFLFWCYFDLVKRVKFGVSRHFLENQWRKWPEILHADVSWPFSELIRLWLQIVDFLIWCNFDLVKRVKFGVSRHFGHALWTFDHEIGEHITDTVIVSFMLYALMTKAWVQKQYSCSWCKFECSCLYSPGAHPINDILI